MNKGISLFIAGMFGLVLPWLGSYVLGFTAGFAVPQSFVNVTWVWDIVVVQFLGFGLLAMLLAYLHATYFRGSLLTSVMVLFLVCQLAIYSPFAHSVVWINFSVTLTSLLIGFFVARRVTGSPANHSCIA